MATAPPWGSVPAKTAWRSASEAPVDAGRLAVPEADDAVIGGIRPGGGELAAHDRSGGLVLIHRRRVHDRQIGRGPGSLDSGVIAAER